MLLTDHWYHYTCTPFCGHGHTGQLAAVTTCIFPIYLEHVKIRKSVTYTTVIYNATFFSPKFSESKSKFLQSSPTVNRDRNSVGRLNIQSGLLWRSICIFATTPIHNARHNTVKSAV